MDYIIIIYIFFSVLPSLVWLFYYLRKDAHPEPKKIILKIFLWGALMVLPAFFIQNGFIFLLGKININPLAYSLIYCFLVAALSEEFLKYLVIREKIINSPDLDEPLDVMLYMVIAALGFAALENILYLPPVENGAAILVFDFVRFIGATFLHTLCSAVVGYSLAISFCQAKWRRATVALGILTATLLHGLYNFSIMTLDRYSRVIIPTVIILTLAFLVFAGFDRLKKMKSVCKIN